VTVRLPPPGSFALHLLDVGQGEAILLDLPNNAFALIDGGPPGAQDMILPLLSARRSEGREFRFAAFSHWDADHIGGLIPVLRALPPVELFRPSIDYDLIRILCSRTKDRSLPRLIDEMVTLEATMQVQPIGARGSIRDLGPGVEIATDQARSKYSPIAPSLSIVVAWTDRPPEGETRTSRDEFPQRSPG
jgi:hypothetical protein